MAERATKLEATVVVLNYRTPDLVVDCLASLERQVSPGVREVVVVDNCSPDDSAERIRKAIADRGWAGWARVVASPVNGGFAAGNNVGVRAADAGIYILLNSDTIVRPGAIDTLVGALRGADDRVGIIGPRLEWPDGEAQVSTFRFRSPLTELISASRSGWLGRRFLGHVVARPVVRAVDDLDWVSFACVAIRDAVFERVGMIDERYFMYYEDMDFCRRAKGAGFLVGHEPAARVVHLRGGSSEVKRNTVERKRRPAYYYAARSHYFHTWYGPVGRWAANLLWICGWGLAACLGRSDAVEREWRDIWTPADAGRPQQAGGLSGQSAAVVGGGHG
ncbi:MAG: glycosyltransferase family 2 protein [Phycisphaerales bacterium]|nr:glycosyltransferase family 2 protein [Planctomycetota bacterium]MCH8507175.1 glycosyltransferase family 2 protein [Phycisphaerales bacterium]